MPFIEHSGTPEKDISCEACSINISKECIESISAAKTNYTNTIIDILEEEEKYANHSL